jgi:hypothetical protein
MMLIVVYTSAGCIGRCDARCYEAQEPHCECICGGANHGAGLQHATENTRQYAEVMIETYAGAKGLAAFRAELGPVVEQLSLW